jgi:hypothetical protein
MIIIKNRSGFTGRSFFRKKPNLHGGKISFSSISPIYQPVFSRTFWPADLATHGTDEARLSHPHSAETVPAGAATLPPHVILHMTFFSPTPR